MYRSCMPEASGDIINIHVVEASRKRRQKSSLLLASAAAALRDARRWLMGLCAILLTSSEIGLACFVSSSTVSFAWSQHNTIRGELQHN